MAFTARLGECAFVEVGSNGMAGEKSGLSGQFILGVAASLAAAAIWVVLASFWKVMNDERWLPLWGFLTIFTVLILGFAWILFLATRNLRAEIADDAETFKNWEKAEADWEESLQQRDEDYGKQLGNWAQAEKRFKDRVAELEEELQERDEVVYSDGFYYRKTDTAFRQPFCRICWETNKQLTTIVDRTTLDNGYRYYQCSVCREQHQLPSLPVGDPDAYEPPDEDIPF